MNKPTDANHNNTGWKKLVIIITGITAFVALTLVLDISFSDQQDLSINPLNADTTDTSETDTSKTAPLFAEETNLPTIQPPVRSSKPATTRATPVEEITTKTAMQATIQTTPQATNNKTAPNDSSLGDTTQDNASLDDIYDRVFERALPSVVNSNHHQTPLSAEEMAIAAAITGIATGNNVSTGLSNKKNRTGAKQKSAATSKKNTRTKTRTKTKKTNTKTAARTPKKPKQRGTNKTHNAPPANAVVTAAELKTLLSQLMHAYNTGDLARLVSVFSENLHSNDASGRKNIEEDYRKLFNITDMRKMQISPIQWSEIHKQRHGEGKFKLLVREKGAANATTYAGNISIDVEKSEGNVLITRLNYHYNN